MEKAGKKLRLLWLELTGLCQLVCGHCYSDSGPAGSHGEMTEADWLRVIDQAAAAGVGAICFIGGEPTLHPSLGALIERALDHGISVEVYTNLVHVPDSLWPLFERDGVTLATSYYSDDAHEHEVIVGRATLARTTANIRKARERGIAVRVGMVRVLPDQRVEMATRVLEGFGIRRIGVDDLRSVGRGAGDKTPGVEALCGACARGTLAVDPDGCAYPCVFARWMRVGDLRQQPLAEVLGGAPLAATRRRLQQEFDARAGSVGCDPNLCDPDYFCSPDGNGDTGDRVTSAHDDCGPDCNPPACDPNACAPFVCAPDNGRVCAPHHG